jgi:hypothetical protein
VSNGPNGIAGEHGFAQRLSPLIAACGVVAVPALLVRHQARLHLSNAEVIYLLHVLSYRWDGTHWPWVAVSAVAEAVGAHADIVRRWKSSLQTKGYLVCKPRIVPGVGRRADEHDLSGLFAALEALAEEEETHKALDQIRSDLPIAQYRRGMADVPQLSTGRPRKNTQARAGENTGAGAGKNTGAPPTKTPSRDPVKTPDEIELRDAEDTNRKRPKRPSSETGRLGAAAPRPEHWDMGTDDSSSMDIAEAAPGYLDDGITSYIVEWGTELGDDDTERSLERAHRMWWNSKLERGRFHNAMKAAKHVTLTRMASGQVGGRPMAYFFGVLAGAAADQCVRAGLPMPRGWELTDGPDSIGTVRKQAAV